jgi:uncharacterized RDD family membrane protein YckC
MSTPPPGWIPPRVAAASAATTPTLRPAAAALRGESRRHLDSRRAAARVLDWLVVAPVVGIAVYLWGWHIGTYALYHCALLIYHHVGEVTRGSTIGKRAFGLRVANLADGGLPRPRQAAARGVIGIAEFGVVAPIVIVCNRGRRRLGDFVAGTAVVDARVHPAEPRPVWSGALSYPLVWAVPTLVACVLGARGEVPGSYRYEADHICARTQAVAARFSDRFGPVDLMLGKVQAERVDLVRLHPPALWRDRHDQLLRRLATQERELETTLALGTPATLAARLPELQAAAGRDAAALRALGYDGCGHA